MLRVQREGRKKPASAALKYFPQHPETIDHIVKDSKSHCWDSPS